MLYHTRRSAFISGMPDKRANRTSENGAGPASNIAVSRRHAVNIGSYTVARESPGRRTCAEHHLRAENFCKVKGQPDDEDLFSNCTVIYVRS
jgi:hypothetical protein